VLDYDNLTHLLDSLRLRGVKGTTGTQASFLKLFEGDDDKVMQLERKITAKMGFDSAYSVTGQTYSRKVDYHILSVLSGIAQSACKFGIDIRLLMSKRELAEPIAAGQVGSSAMAYKRNPMRSERLCALARYAISLPINAAMTASTQWLERSLDDSANRRIVMAQGLLSVDGVLNLYLDIVQGLDVHPKIIERNISQELPFMATEDILMQCVRSGADRQVLHEALRVHSAAAAKRMRNGEDCDLMDRIAGDDKFGTVHGALDSLLQASAYVGRAPKQAKDFVDQVVRPILNSNAKLMSVTPHKIDV
jgi:adenylosuccinate lyase